LKKGPSVLTTAEREVKFQCGKNYDQKEISPKNIDIVSSMHVMRLMRVQRLITEERTNRYKT